MIENKQNQEVRCHENRGVLVESFSFLDPSHVWVLVLSIKSFHDEMIDL